MSITLPNGNKIQYKLVKCNSKNKNQNVIRFNTFPSKYRDENKTISNNNDNNNNINICKQQGCYNLNKYSGLQMEQNVDSVSIPKLLEETL